MPKVLPILTYPARSLKKASVDVQKVTSRVTDLVQDMFETTQHAHGVGLAASQVGENLNILVMDVTQPDPHNPEQLTHHPLCLINPKITQAEGIIVYEEGCLSCPELLVKMERAQKVTVQGLDACGRPVIYDLSDLEAVCLQHELDHLRGKLLTDHISRLKRDLYRKQLIRKREDV